MMHKPAKLCTKPDPSTNSAPRVHRTIKATYRPIVSESGPPNTGPRASAKVYKEMGTRDCVRVTANSSWSQVTAGAMVGVPRDLLIGV